MAQPAQPTSGDPTPDQPNSAPPAQPTNQPGDPAAGDKPLGPGGEKALREERETRKALERQLQEQAAKFAPLERLAEALAGDQGKPGGKSEVELLQEKFDRYERDLAAERQARWRVEVAAEKHLPAGLAERLQGATRAELADDADKLAALIPATPAQPGTPRPDPTQGARGATVNDLDAQIADAEAKGDVRRAIALKARKLTQSK